MPWRMSGKNAGSSESREFENAPDGQYAAICCDVVDMGDFDNPYPDEKTGEMKPPQHKFTFAFLLGGEEGAMKNGKPFLVRSSLFSASLYPGGKFVDGQFVAGKTESNASKFIKAWRGKAFSEAEVDSFDVECLLGIPAYVTVTNETNKKGKTYANVTNISPLPKKMRGDEPDLEGYERVQDRDGYKAPKCDCGLRHPADAAGLKDDKIPVKGDDRYITEAQLKRLHAKKDEAGMEDDQLHAILGLLGCEKDKKTKEYSAKLIKMSEYDRIIKEIEEAVFPDKEQAAE